MSAVTSTCRPLAECATVHPGQHILEHAYNRRGEGVGYLTGPADFGKITPVVCRWTNSPKAWAEPGDVLITVKGAGVGKCNLAPTSKVAIGRQLMAIRPSPILSQVFLFHYFRLAFEDFQRAALGATVPGLGKYDIESLLVPLPPLAEQQQIAARLTEQLAVVDRARAAAQARLAAAEALPAAYLREVFEGPEAAEWAEQPLGDGLANMQTGTSAQTQERPARADEWGVLKVSAVTWDEFDPAENKAVPPNYTPEPHEVVRSGDLLISRANTQPLVGAVALVRDVPGRLMLSDKTLRLVPKSDCYDSAFLKFAMRTRSTRRFIEHQATGSSESMRNISQGTIRRIPIRSPGVADQRRIAAGLSAKLAAANSLAAACRAELAAVAALPAALLRQAFAGGN